MKLKSEGEIPNPRSGAKFVSWKDSLILFGGYNSVEKNYFNDIFVYNIK